MDTFFTPGRIWAGPLLHVYLVQDLRRDQQLAALVGRCQDAASRLAFLAPMRPEWLHVTLAKITVPSDRVTTEQRGLLASRLTDAVAGLDRPP